jgi:hypothetical protein
MMNTPSHAATPDEVRERLAKLKRDAYPMVILFYITKRVITGLGISEGLEESEVDNIIFNTMIDKLVGEQKGD